MICARASADKGVATEPVALGYDQRPLIVRPAAKAVHAGQRGRLARVRCPKNAGPDRSGNARLGRTSRSAMFLLGPFPTQGDRRRAGSYVLSIGHEWRRCWLIVWICADMMHPHSEPPPMAVINEGYVPPRAPCRGPSCPGHQHCLERGARSPGGLFEHGDDHEVSKQSIRTGTATKMPDPSAHHRQPRPHSSPATLAPVSMAMILMAWLQCMACG
jgi:hypothetical protein